MSLNIIFTHLCLFLIIQIHFLISASFQTLHVTQLFNSYPFQFFDRTTFCRCNSIDHFEWVSKLLYVFILLIFCQLLIKFDIRRFQIGLFILRFNNTFFARLLNISEVFCCKQVYCTQTYQLFLIRSHSSILYNSINLSNIIQYQVFIMSVLLYIKHPRPLLFRFLPEFRRPARDLMLIANLNT